MGFADTGGLPYFVHTVGRWLAAAENKDVLFYNAAGDKPPPYGLMLYSIVTRSDNAHHVSFLILTFLRTGKKTAQKTAVPITATLATIPIVHI